MIQFDEVMLIELEDYIKALYESVGLRPETYRDIMLAIEKEKGKLHK